MRRTELMNALAWLLDADPAIRWQALRDLADVPADQVAAERSRVATSGWGARLLARQRPDGLWDAGTKGAEFSTLLALLILRDMGLDPESTEARQALDRANTAATWSSPGSWQGTKVFAGEVEPCINGRVLAAGAYFGLDMATLAQRLLGEQMADGGWNCEQENGSIRGSFHTTINVLEGLLEYARAGGESPEVSAALARGQDYLLERNLLRRRSTGELVDPGFTRFAFPCGYRYDALRALDHLRDAAVRPEARMDEAVLLLRSRRGADGRWPLEHSHEVEMVNARTRDLDFGMDEQPGQPSLWNTLRGMRVLSWYERGR
jgi:hypothetical protein